MLRRIHFDDRESWLAGRQAQFGFGGSEAAAAIGLSPWETPIELWKRKLGLIPPKDLSGNASVEQGNRMEPILRAFYAGMRPEYRIVHYPFDILFQEERPWMFASLDGELLLDDRRGILEIKTATPNGKAGWEKWADGKMPQNYYVQCLHQLLATGYDFVNLFAVLYSMNGDITLREYEIEREDVKSDLDWLMTEETKAFGYLERGEMPPQRLIL